MYLWRGVPPANFNSKTSRNTEILRRCFGVPNATPSNSAGFKPSIFHSRDPEFGPADRIPHAWSSHNFVSRGVLLEDASGLCVKPLNGHIISVECEPDKSIESLTSTRLFSLDAITGSSCQLISPTSVMVLLGPSATLNVGLFYCPGWCTLSAAECGR